MTQPATIDFEQEALRRFFDRELAELSVEPGATVEMIDGGAPGLAGSLADILAELAAPELAPPPVLDQATGEGLFA